MVDRKVIKFIDTIKLTLGFSNSVRFLIINSLLKILLYYKYRFKQIKIFISMMYNKNLCITKLIMYSYQKS